MGLCTLGAATACPSTPGTYVIKSGDGLTAIATMCGTTLQCIQAANPSITDPNSIQPGQRLQVPSSCAASTAPAPAPTTAAASTSGAPPPPSLALPPAVPPPPPLRPPPPPPPHTHTHTHICPSKQVLFDTTKSKATLTHSHSLTLKI